MRRRWLKTSLMGVQTMKVKRQYRDVEIALDGSSDERKVSLAFSSEEPVRRSYGMEILDHSHGAIVMDYMRSGAPLLVGHNCDDQVGVVESVEIGDDRVGRAVVRFGRSKRANEIFNDVTDGIRKFISVGYDVLKVVKEGDDIYRAVSWMPVEISIVPVPADVTVGIGRSVVNEVVNEVEIIENKKEKRSIEMPTENKDIKAEYESALKEARKSAAQDERSRVAEMIELGERFNAVGLAREHISKGKNINAFRSALLERQERNEAVGSMGDKPATELGMADSDAKRYSIIRAINAAATGDWSKAGFERECSISIADKIGREARGFFVPFDVQTRVSPPMNTTDQTSLVGTTHLAASFIEQLRNQSVVARLGARLLTGLVGNVDIPKQTAGSTFTWLAENGASTDSDLTIGQVSLSPKTIGGAIPMTRRLLKQGTPDAEMLARSDLIQGAALAIDVGALSGTGAAGQPLGIMNTTGINTQAIADLANGFPTFAEMVGFETAVLTDNALMGAMNYVTTPAIQGHLKTTFVDTGSGIRIQQDGQVNGYNSTATNQLSAKSILFGNFNDCLIGMWGVLDLSVDTSTLASSGGIVVRAFQDVDVAVRHAESFCKNA